jgi:hypothetical protein
MNTFLGIFVIVIGIGILLIPNYKGPYKSDKGKTGPGKNYLQLHSISGVNGDMNVIEYENGKVIVCQYYKGGGVDCWEQPEYIKHKLPNRLESQYE